MDIVDAQVHPSLPPSPQFPWSLTFAAGKTRHETERFADSCVSGDELIKMMNEAGVGSAIAVSRAMTYGEDDSYAFDCAARYPGRFAVVSPISPHTPDAEARIAAFRRRPFALGIRVILLPEEKRSFDTSGFRRIFAAAEAVDVPVFIAPGGKLAGLENVARDHPCLKMVLDHLGLMPGKREYPFEHLEAVLDLARFDNVFLKWSAAPRLARETFPFEDIWPVLLRTMHAYGTERLMWGSDITQHLSELTYLQSVDFVRVSPHLSAREKELILGGNVRSVLGWPTGRQTSDGTVQSD